MHAFSNGRPAAAEPSVSLAPSPVVFQRLLLWLSPAALLTVWAVASQQGWFPRQILVPPATVLDAGVELWQSGELWLHLQDSLRRLLAGFLAGALGGLAFGTAMGLSRAVEQSFGPLFHALRQVPSIAFIPMLILLLGVEESFKIVIVAKAAFFPVALATADAVHGIPRGYFDVARAYRLPLPLLLRRVVLPATVPPVVTGLRISLGRSWMVLVAAELLAADSGIGQMMEMGRQMFRLDIVLLGVVVTGLVGFALDRGFRAIEARLAGWQRA